MTTKINNNVYWVGKTDWELRKFHGDEYSTFRGSSYNSYLIKEEKTALIDTVWAPYAGEFAESLSKEINLNDIDYIIISHGEIDHSGALPELMRHIPETPIYCTKNALKSLKGQFHKDWNFNVVKTGDKLSLGSKELVFVETPMLHWPDSMMVYLTDDNILFSSDAFGQHFATENLYNDQVDQNELFKESEKYYANILTPFSPLVIKKINEILALNLPLDLICPSHGIIWRENPAQIVEQYLKWADNYKENQISVIYDTMWNGTRKMAENIVKGIQESDKDATVKIMNVSKTDKNEIVTEIFKSKAIMIGSPTKNKGVLTGVSSLLEEIKGLKFCDKKAAGFGSYGWSGESANVITKQLEESGFEIVDNGIKITWNPDGEGVAKCIAYGREFADKVK